jgi:hypothetical protein
MNRLKDSLVTGAMTQQPRAKLWQPGPRLSKQITNPPGLRLFAVHNHSTCNLTISFSNSYSIREQLTQLGAYPQANIYSLSLNFSSCNNLTNKDILMLGKLLKRNFPQLRQFALEVAENSKITAEGYQHLANALSHLKSLTELKLKLSLRLESELTVYYLTNSIKKISGLQKLTIAFSSYTALSNKLLAYLADSIEHHTGLIELSIAFDDFRNTLYDGIDRLINSLKRLVQLKKLNLYLERTKVSPQNLGNLAATFQQLNQLLGLGLSLEGTTLISEECWGEIAQSIASLAQLIEFDFEGGFNITSQSISYLADAIGQLTQLSSLGLYFAFNRYLTNEVWQGISQSISHLTQLRKLDLAVSWCSALNDQAIIELGTATHNLKLQSLKLNFSNNKLSNLGLTALAQSISNLPALTRCQLNLDHCRQLDEEGIAALITGIGKVAELTSLNLQLQGCKLTDNNLQQLGESLSQGSHFAQLDLGLRECRNITDHGIIELANHLKNIPSLAKLGMVLTSSAQITQHSEQALKDLVAGQLNREPIISDIKLARRQF